MGVRLGRSSRYDRHCKVRIVSKLQRKDRAALDYARRSFNQWLDYSSKSAIKLSWQTGESTTPETLICHH